MGVRAVLLPAHLIDVALDLAVHGDHEWLKFILKPGHCLLDVVELAQCFLRRRELCDGRRTTRLALNSLLGDNERMCPEVLARHTRLAAQGQKSDRAKRGSLVLKTHVVNELV